MAERARSALALGVLLLAPTALLGAGGGGYIQHAGNDLSNVASLQRGAGYFVNYCHGCHSAQYVRYQRIADDLELSEERVMQNLMFTVDKTFDTMRIAMPPQDANRWFGRTPPDLSLVARSRGVDWVYSFLKSFYADESKPLGVNNLVLQGASMPHVLWELQGMQRAVFETVEDAEGNRHEQFVRFEQLSEGSLSAGEYDQFVRDLVNFLDYIGEPVQLQRQRLGIWVLVFLLVFFLLAYALKKEYWKEVK